jgi:hypothetical protein
VAKSYEFLKRNYYWPGMLKNVKEYVRAYVSCQQNKVEQLKPTRLLQPLPIPEGTWESISLDFIMQLSMSSNIHYDAIMVVVCRLSKQAHFIPTHTTISIIDTTKLFFKEILRLHGMPKTLISDRDVRFISKFWTSLFKLMNVGLNMSTVFHPQTDG